MGFPSDGSAYGYGIAVLLVDTISNYPVGAWRSRRLEYCIDMRLPLMGGKRNCSLMVLMNDYMNPSIL